LERCKTVDASCQIEEGRKPVNFPKHLVESYFQRFCNRPDVYAKQNIRDNKCSYEAVYAPVTLEVIDAHLVGQHTIGFYSLDQNNTGKWLCIDFDYEGSDAKNLVDLFKRHGWYCLPEARRPGRDGHLWLFFDLPVPGVHLRRFAHEFLINAGISLKVEVFPKQDKLKHGSRVGNLVRGPLGIHRKPGANNIRGWFEDAPKDVLAQLEWFHGQKANRSSDLLNFAQGMEARDLISKAIKRPSKPSKSASTSGGIDWLAYAIRNGFKQRGQFRYGPCPSCKGDGHDSDNDHLYIHDGGGVGCWRGCSGSDIVAAIAR
jgi:hypothetical protein